VREELKNSWWVSAGNIERERESALISIEFDKAFRDYSKLKKEIWNLYRARAGREDLSPVAKLLLWSVCERYRWQTWSSHDAISYYCKMIGVHRTSASRGMSELLEKEILWCVLEGERKRLRKSQAGGKKHFLLVGLSAHLREQVGRDS
jgi:hypothetical protein